VCLWWAPSTTSAPRMRVWGTHPGPKRLPWLPGYRSCLDRRGTTVVACAAAVLEPTQAARASFAGIEMPDRAVVLMTTVECGATSCGLFGQIAFFRQSPLWERETKWR